MHKQKADLYGNKSAFIVLYLMWRRTVVCDRGDGRLFARRDGPRSVSTVRPTVRFYLPLFTFPLYRTYLPYVSTE